MTYAHILFFHCSREVSRSEKEKKKEKRRPRGDKEMHGYVSFLAPLAGYRLYEIVNKLSTVVVGMLGLFFFSFGEMGVWFEWS